MLDIVKLRTDFPILERKINDQKLIYLDNAATTQKPESVLLKMDKFYRNHNANIHRGVYPLAEESTVLYDEARTAVAEFINADFEEIVFTRNATESINLVADSWGKGNVKRGDNIVISIMEHHSNILPWQVLVKENGAELRFVDIKEDCALDLEDLKSKIDSKTKLIAISHVSNTLGIINPIEEIIAIAKEKNIKILIDACQSIPHLPIDVRKLNCDFLVFSGHKMLGPMGIGVLFTKKDILENMPPFLLGGDMIQDVSKNDFSVNKIPYKFEAGTQNVAGAIGLKEAILYLKTIDFSLFQNHERALLDYAIKRFSKISQVEMLGSLDLNNKIGILSFNVKGLHPHDLAGLLGEKNICIRAGKHCTHPLLERLNFAAVARISFYLYNTREDLDIFFEEMNTILRKWLK